MLLLDARDEGVLGGEDVIIRSCKPAIGESTTAVIAQGYGGV
jgi:hypothetical protein